MALTKIPGQPVHVFLEMDIGIVKITVSAVFGAGGE
jgi:hypothetical protein